MIALETKAEIALELYSNEMTSYKPDESQFRAGQNFGLRDCKRYICGHDPDGKSVYLKSPDLVYHTVPNVGALARSYSVESTGEPMTNNADVEAYVSDDGEKNVGAFVRPDITRLGGANLLIINIAPGGRSQMHKTVSIDFSTCLEGEILHELDGGETQLLLPGASKIKGLLTINTNLTLKM